ncbi:unnamed protein product [Medioppia subpectinata]|uniref:Uncharacterized protein n=1 Tax=Medioppia subpectinata TaxID=1979941 RepID=A0A7R9PWX6_9ACAR|nr:unnamed protein product [Medioppia subpectinata]CAG2103790.1 unnamed protein product [Medioppia subpectinata]
MPNILTKLAPKVSFVESIPVEFRNKRYGTARKNSGLTNEMLVSFEIRALVADKCYRNPHHSNALSDTNLQLTEAFGRPLEDGIDLTGFDDEWQKKYLLGESDGTTGYDVLLIKSVKLMKHMLNDDQYVRHVLVTVRWFDSYLTVNLAKYDDKLFTYEQYWELRDQDSAADISGIMMERVNNLDVMSHIGLTDDPIRVALMKAAGKHCVLTNEVY